MFWIRHRACLCVLAAAAFAVGPGKAEQFWVDYEGDDYPENQGWTREYGNENGPYAGGANRSVANGIFTLDSLADDQIYDFYERQRTVDPGPGELFVAEWRMLVDTRSTPHDVGVFIFRALSPGYAYFMFSPGGVYIMPGRITIGLEQGVFHSCRFESPDMRSYTLLIDDTIAFNGQFEDFTLLQHSVAFGDGVQGERSLSQWDYFRYGIVPEPTSVAGLAWLVASSLLRRGTRRSCSSRGGTVSSTSTARCAKGLQSPANRGPRHQAARPQPQDRPIMLREGETRASDGAGAGRPHRSPATGGPTDVIARKKGVVTWHASFAH